MHSDALGPFASQRRTPIVSDYLALSHYFLITPQYQAEIVAAEQNQEWIDIYFQASEGLYLYLDTRLNEGFEAA